MKLVFLVALTGVFLYTRAGVPTRVYAVTSSTLNFQARLLSSSGAIVPDGTYSVQFKLYSAVSGGVAQWTETQGSVTVKAGYLSVYLGSGTSFPGTIDWSQEQWLTMNVNGDGEMSPRLKLTAVPYAFRAGQADSLTNGASSLTASNLAQLGPSAPQAVNLAVAALRISQTGAGGLLQLQQSGVDIFSVAANGDLTTSGSATFSGGALNLGSATQLGGLVLNDGAGKTGTLQTTTLGVNRIYTLPNADGTVCLTTTCGGAANSFIQDGNSFSALTTLGTNDNFDLNFETNGITKLKILTNGNVGIGTSGTPSALLSIGGTTGNLTVDSFGNLITNGSITGVGVSAGSGLLQGTGGLTLIGTTLLNTTGTANTSVGNATGNFTLLSSGLNVTAGGNITTTGTYNTNTFTGTALTFGGASGTVSTATTNAALTLQSNGAGTLSLDSGTTGAINIGTGTNAKTITLGNATGATSLVLNAGTGAINIGTNAIAHTTTIGNVTGASSVVVNCGTGACSFGASATVHTTTVGSATGAAITNLQAGTGGLSITTQGTGALNIGNNAVAQTINLGNNTGATIVSVLAGTGGLNIGTGGIANTVQIGNTTGAVTQNINLGNNATASSVTNVVVGSAVSGTTTINGASGISIGTGPLGPTVQIGNNTNAVSQTINIGNNATVSSTDTVIIGSTIGSSSTTLQAGSGGLVLNTSTIKRTASGTTTWDLIDGADTVLALTNSGAGVANFTTDGRVTAGNGLTVSAGGATITGNSTIAGTLTGLTGLTSSGAITLSGLSAGLVQSTSGGVLSSGAVDRNSAAFFNTALTIANGGTGAGTFTTNGVLFGNGTSALGVTAAGTTGQCLIATTGSAPAWGSCAGAGSGVSLQSAYNGGAVVTAADAKDISFTLADTTTDSNFLVNIATGSTSKFAVQSNGTDVLRVTSAGTVINTGGLTVSAGGASITGNTSVASGTFTSSGGVIKLNDASNFGTSINTGSSSGTITLGGGSSPLVIDSTNFDVSAAGALSGITTIATSGTINTNTFTGTNLTFGGVSGTISTTSNGNLTLSPNGSGVLALSTGSTGLLTTNASTIQRTASGITSFDLVDSSNTTFALKNSGAGVLNLTVDGNGTFGTGLTVSAGGASVTGNTSVASGTFTSSGGLISLNDTSNFGTNINTGSSTGTITFGGGSSPLVIDSTAFDVTVGGNISTPGTYNTNTFNGTTLTFGGASGAISTTGNGNLTIGPAGSGVLSLNTGSGGTLTTNAGTIQRSGASGLIVDLANAGTTTLTVTNSDASNVANLSVEGGITAGTNSAFSVNSDGDVTGVARQIDGSSTANGGSGLGSSTGLVLISAANFDVGNYVRVTSANCGGTGINPCYAKITAKATNTLTIAPALTWANASAVVEFHFPEIGGVDTAQTLANRYGRGYFISGVATGNGTTFYNEDSVTSSLANFDFLSGVTGTLSIGVGANQISLGGSGTTTTFAGNVSFTGTVSGIGPSTGTSGYLQRNGTVISPATAGDSFTTSGSISTSGSGTITAAAGLTVQGGGAIITGNSSVTGTLGVSNTLTVSGGGASVTGGLTLATGALNLSSGGITNSGALAGVAGITFSSGGLNLASGGITNAGAISGITGLTFTSGSLNLAGGGITNGGAFSGVTTLGLSGAITGATATNTINGLVINSGALSNITSISASGAITAATTINTINGLIISSGALSGATTINASGLVTSAGLTAGSGLIQGTGGLTITGSISLNANASTNTTSIGTGTTTGQITIGGGSTPLVINTPNFGFDSTNGLSVTGKATFSTRTYVPGTSGTTGQGYFTGSPTTSLGSFQSLDLSGSTYSFLGNNKYYNGSAWVDNGLARVGSSFQIQNDAFTFYSFNTGTTFTPRFAVASGGNVGIGTAAASPQAVLHVASTATTYTTYTDIGGTTATLGASFLEQTVTDSSFTNPYRGAVNKTIANFTSDPGAKSILGGYNEVGVPSGNATAMASATLRATNNAVTYGGTSTLGTGAGLVTVIRNQSTGTITNAISLQGQIQNNSTGTIGTSYGLQVSDLVNTGTITTTYGVYVGDVTTGTQTNQAYSFYAVDANALNYFAGNVGIGDASPLATLTVGNGDLFQVAGATGNVTTAGDVAVNGGDITSTGALKITSGGGLDLTLDSGSNKIVIAGTDSIIQRNSAGTTTLDLLNAGSATSLIISNSDATQVANLNVEGIYQSGGTSGLTIAACTAGQYLGNGVATKGGIVTAGSCRNDATGISDVRVKKDITSVGSVLDKLSGVRVVTFNFKVDELPELNLDHGLQYGVIAQELEQIFPELVQQRDDGYKEVNFKGLSFYTLKAVTELSAKVDSLGGGATSSSESVSTGGVLRLTKDGALQNITGLNLVSGGASISGGVNNNNGGFTNVGTLAGATTIDAQSIALHAGASEDMLKLTKDNNGVFTIFNNGALEIRLDASNAFAVKKANGDDVFSVNTAGGLVRIGAASDDSKAVLLVLDSLNTAGDPTGVNGAQYYNSASNKFRCFQDGKWQDCLSAAATSEYVLAEQTQTWQQPVSETEFPGESRTWVDLSQARELRLTARLSTAGAETANCRLQYASGDSGPWSDLSDQTSADLALKSSGSLKTEWSAIKPDARHEVLIRVVCTGGNYDEESTAVGAVPKFSGIKLQIR